MHLLIIAFEFAPLNVGGTMRPLRFANYMVQKGHSVTVICGNYTGSEWERKEDQGLLSKINPAIRIIRVPIKKIDYLSKFIRTGYSFFMDEVWSRWGRNVMKAIKKEMAFQPPSVVLVTMPPFSLYQLVLWLKRNYQVPVIADFRDAWTLWVNSPFASRLHFTRFWNQEDKVLKTADAVLVTSPVTQKDFKNHHQGISSSKLYYIPNSFDQYEAASFHSFNSEKEKLRIVYVGTFYYNPISQALINKKWYQKKVYQWLQYIPRKEDWLYRSPLFFFKALDLLLQEYPEYISRLEVVVAGIEPGWWTEMVNTDRLQKVVKHIGPVSKERSVQLQKEADILLLTSNKVEMGDDYSIAGKTYEYFAARKPIWGVVCNGAQQWILEQSGIALCLDPDDTPSSSVKMHNFLQGKIVLRENQPFINQFKTKLVGDGFEEVALSLVNKK